MDQRLHCGDPEDLSRAVESRLQSVGEAKVTWIRIVNYEAET